jgi:hypothetical protein
VAETWPRKQEHLLSSDKYPEKCSCGEVHPAVGRVILPNSRQRVDDRGLPITDELFELALSERSAQVRRG